MASYDDFWKQAFHDILKKIDPIKATSFSVDVNTLPTLGNREVSGYDGKLITWIGQVWQSTDSAVFRSLRRQIDSIGQLVNRVPGELIMRVQNNSTLLVEYTPISYDLLIAKYGDIPIDRKNMEIYKWQLIQKYQEGWNDYINGNLDFQSFFLRTDFRNLIYPIGMAVLKHPAKDEPHAFEKLILDLYDENKDLKVRVADFKEGFKNLYFTLEGHGKNTILEERTIATLLTFRYPEKYTFFKDSFYSVLCKGLGLKPEKAGQKMFHYYDLVKDFVTNYLPKYPQTIQNNKKLLDSTCYPDPKNMILSQDILYLNLNIGEKPVEETDYDTEDAPVPLEQFSEPDPEYKKQLLFFPLNQILYGPPGTGKTFNTISKAIEIVDNRFYKANINNRPALTQRFKDLLITEKDWSTANGQIAFITFHQSMSYEDFVEGIKPDLTQEGSNIKYQIEPGLFRKICNLAGVHGNLQDNFTAAYDRLMGEIEAAGGSLELRTLVKNKPFRIYENSKGNIKFHAETDKATEAVIRKDFILTYLQTGELLDWPTYTKAVGEYMKSNLEYYSEQTKETKRFVLIIDEINRGNISQIFGELITLIEDDKRKNGLEEMSAILPYSKTSFTVPSNLHIVGTMNTADRSVEALDTALRRRFVFEEKAPQPELLTPERMVWQLWWNYSDKKWDDIEYIAKEAPLYKLLGFPDDKNNNSDKDSYWTPMHKAGIDPSQAFTLADLNFSGINLALLLTAINKRIEKVLSRDYCIGHAYLINVGSLDELREAFTNKILPLLQEYFFGDCGRIGLIIGEVFLETNQQKASIDLMKVSKYDAGSLNQTVIYSLVNIKEWEESEFITNIKAIYDK